MEVIEEELKNLILSKYKSIREFTNAIDMPYSTADSILKRGIKKSSVDSVIKICEKLGISTDALINGEIEYKKASTLAAHFDGEEYTEEELTKINEFAKFVKSSRK